VRHDGFDGGFRAGLSLFHAGGFVVAGCGVAVVERIIIGPGVYVSVKIAGARSRTGVWSRR
jgi:hypothetical protein